MKIAQVTVLDLSIQVLLLDQIKALQEMGHEVIAVCAPGPRVERIREQGIPVETVPMARELSPVRDLRSLYLLHRCFRKHHFDVVHTHTPKAGLLGPVAAQWAGVPVVVHTVHGLLFHDAMPRWKRWLFWLPEKATASFTDYLLCQSREDVDVAARTRLCSAKQLTYLGYGVDTAPFVNHHGGSADSSLRRNLGLKDEDFVVGCVGRLVYEKGFGELFATAEKLTAKHKEIKFIVIGPTEQDKHDAVPSERIAALARRGVVAFLGWRDDMAECYSMMDVFVLPSHREGLPRACLEAAVMARPVIASNIRGCREVVKPGQTGLLVPVRNAEALAQAIEQLLGDRRQAAAMGQQGLRYIVENFDAKQGLVRLLAFYSRVESLLAGGCRGPDQYSVQRPGEMG